jgi:Family of unknown function (DUF6134)
MAGILDRCRAIRCVFASLLMLGALLAAHEVRSEQQSGPRQLAALPQTGRFDYDVIREGDRIGTHSVVFRRDGRSLAIATRTDIAVTLLGITFYRFRYEAQEDWLDGRLNRLTSRTDNDGEPLTVDLASSAGRIRGTCNGIALDLPADLLPISPWHPDFVRQSVILDQYKCAERKVRATDRGIESVLAGKHSVATRHYAVTGEIQRDLWYGPDGQTVQVLMPAKDGSEVTLVMRTPP